jgi:L-lactate dehydrogenase complex protein LldE
VCEKFAADFADAACIVTPSASCTGFIRNYAEKLFEEDGQAAASGIRSVKEKLFELSDFLVHTPGLKPLDARLEATVTYHDSCAALRECHIKQEPRMLLQQVKGLQLTEMEDVETCCGFGGSFAVKFEPISIAMADQKITHAQATGARYIVSTDMSCLMHLEGRLQHLESPVKVLHLAEVLAAGL